MGRRVQGETCRSFSFHEGPQAFGDIVDFNDASIGCHIAADDLAVPIDVIDSAVQTSVGPCGNLSESDVAVAGYGRFIRVTGLRQLIRYDLSCGVISCERLPAGDAGGCQHRPLGTVILHDGCLKALGCVFLYLCLQLCVLVGFLPQEPVIILHVLVISILIGEAAGIDVAGGISAGGLVALVVPDISLQGHEQAAGDLAGVVRDVGHHPFDIFLRGHVHLSQAGLGDDLIPERIRVCAGGCLIGIGLEEGLRSVMIGVAQVHTVELSACRGRRPVAVCLAGRRQAGRPQVVVRHRRDPHAGGHCCEGCCREQRQNSQQCQEKGYEFLFHNCPFCARKKEQSTRKAVAILLLSRPIYNFECDFEIKKQAVLSRTA